MKITKSRLKRLIKEEVENYDFDPRVTTEGYMTKMSDEDVKLKGYQDALAGRPRQPNVGKDQVGLIDLYNGAYDMGLEELQGQG